VWATFLIAAFFCDADAQPLTASIPAIPNSLKLPGQAPQVRCPPFSRKNFERNETASCFGRGICTQFGFCRCDPGFSGSFCEILDKQCCQSVDNVCASAKVISSSIGWISDGFPTRSGYTNNINCSWRLLPTEPPPPWRTAAFKLPSLVLASELLLENGYDWLYVDDGPVVNTSRRFASFTGEYPYIDADSKKEFLLPETTSNHPKILIKEKVPDLLPWGVGGDVTIQFLTDLSNIERTKKGSDQPPPFRGFRVFFASPIDFRVLLALQELLNVTSRDILRNQEVVAAARDTIDFPIEVQFPKGCLCTNYTDLIKSGRDANSEFMNYRLVLGLNVSAPYDWSLPQNSSVNVTIEFLSATGRQQFVPGILPSWLDPSTIQSTRNPADQYGFQVPGVGSVFYIPCVATVRSTMPGTYSLRFNLHDNFGTSAKTINTFGRDIEIFKQHVAFLPGAVDSAQSYAKGQGVMYIDSAKAGVSSFFSIFARDSKSNHRLSGGDFWEVLMMKDKNIQQLSWADVINFGNGTYRCEYLLTTSGRYTLAIKSTNNEYNNTFAPDDKLYSSLLKLINQEGVLDFFQSPMQVRDSPFSVYVNSGRVDIAKVLAFGNGLYSGISGFSSYFVLRVMDVFGNQASGQDSITIDFSIMNVVLDSVFISRKPSSPLVTNISFIGSEDLQGDYLCDWAPVVTGIYKMVIQISVDGINSQVPGSPFYTSVSVAPSYAPYSSAKGSGLTDSSTEDVREITVYDRDWFKNDRASSGAFVRVQISGINFQNCRYIEESTIRDVICKCPSLVQSQSMIKCQFGGRHSSRNVADSLKVHYVRKDGKTDQLNPNDQAECFRAWVGNSMQMYYTDDRMSQYFVFDDHSCDSVGFIAQEAKILPEGVRQSLASNRHQAIWTRTKLQSTEGGNQFFSKSFTLKVKENSLGQFFGDFSITQAGLYSIEVTLNQIPILGSPFKAVVKPGSLSARASEVILYGVSSYTEPGGSCPQCVTGFQITTGISYSVQISMRDKFSNYLWNGGWKLRFGFKQGYSCTTSAACFPSDTLDPTKVRTITFVSQSLEDFGDGNYRFNYTVSTSGRYPLQIDEFTSGEPQELAQSPYTIFVSPGDTNAKSSTTSGQGLSACGAGLICTFVVQTRDAFGNVRILDPKKGQFNYSAELVQVTNGDAAPARYLFYALKDAFDGYGAAYNVSNAGAYKLNIELLGIHVKGSPYDVVVSGGLTDPAFCVVKESDSSIGLPGMLTLLARDRFGNSRTSGGENVQIHILGPFPVISRTFDLRNGQYVIEFDILNATKPANYTMSLTILSQEIPGSPFVKYVGFGFDFKSFDSIRPFSLNGASTLVSKSSQKPGLLRLTPAETNRAGSFWFIERQPVMRGFETEFSFQLSERSRNCKTTTVIAERCMPNGGDGLAFVVQYDTVSALGTASSSLGYGGIVNSLAVEFDTWFNVEKSDVYENHVSIQTKGLEPNESHHRSKIAVTTSIPLLQDGNIHTVRIRYEPKLLPFHTKDEKFFAGPNSVNWLKTGAGVMLVFIDDFTRPALVAPINLKDILALPSDGRAFVGFTAATGSAFQNHDIITWSFQEACSQDCNKVGKCQEGVCVCESGYFGESCQFLFSSLEQKDRRDTLIRSSIQPPFIEGAYGEMDVGESAGLMY
jgi:hypothetical protein